MIDKIIHEELREKYNPEGSVLRNHQIQLLQLLDFFDKICKENSIPYWLSSGTCLGAIRHEGFIPWDDDIDVEMLREDYLRFEKVFKESDRFVLQTYDNELFYTEPFPKLRLKENRVSEGHCDRFYNFRGSFMDIFIMEKAPLVPAAFCHCLLGANRHYSFHIKNTGFGVEVFRVLKKINKCVISVCRVLFAFWPQNKLRHTYGTGCERNIRVKNEIFPLSVATFEGRNYPVPKDCHSYLKRMFGNYMEIPSTMHTHNIIKNSDI